MTLFAARAQNLCSQLGDLGNCCHKVLLGNNVMRPRCLPVGREAEEEKGSLFVQGGGGGGGEAHLEGGGRQSGLS